MSNLLSNLTTTTSDGVSPGISTTEFWVAAVTWVLSIVDSFGLHHFTPAQDSLVIAGVPMLYMIVRSLVKTSAASAPPPASSKGI